MKMKKIMVAAAIALVAIVSQASNFRWGAANVYDGTGSATTDTKYSGTAYLFDNATIGMSALFDAFAEDHSYVASHALDTKTVSAGSIASASSDVDFAYGEGGNKYSFYMVLVDGDNIYFSNLKADVAAPTTAAAGNIAFGTQNNNSTTFSASLPSEGFKGAGYWQTASVPEPTSGLLILLGMAGLALRRKQK